MLWAGNLLGFDPSTLRKWRRRDGTFDSDCLKAKDEARTLAMIAGPWQLRLDSFYRLQARYAGDWERAARDSGVSERVAMVIAANITLQQHPRLARAAKLRNGRGAVVIPADANFPAQQPATKVRTQQAAANLPTQKEAMKGRALTMEEATELNRQGEERMKSTLTEPMRRMLAIIGEQHCSMAEAARMCGHSQAEVETMARECQWFRLHLDD